MRTALFEAQRHQILLVVCIIVLLGHLEVVADSNRINIEETMREFNARFNHISKSDPYDPNGKGRWVKWPNCFGCGGWQPAPPKPCDFFYGEEIDREYQRQLVEALVDAFYNNSPKFGDPLCEHFTDPEHALDNPSDPPLYFVVTDFPQTWGSVVTLENYPEVYETVREYILQLTTTGHRETISSMNSDSKSGYGFTICFGSQETTACEAADEARAFLTTDWNGLTWAGLGGNWEVRQALTVNDCGTGKWSADAEFTAKRRQYRWPNVHNHTAGRLSLYLKVDAYPGGASGAGIDPPVEADGEWHPFHRDIDVKSLAFPDYEYLSVDYVGDISLQLPPGCTTFVERGWRVTASGFMWSDTPVFDTKADDVLPCGSLTEGCGPGVCNLPGATTYKVSSIDVRFSLGTINNEQKAGAVRIHEPDPSAALSTPAALQALVDGTIEDADHVVRDGTTTELLQVYTGEYLMHVVVVDAYNYKLEFYRDDQLTGSRNPNGTYIIDVSETPYKTIEVSNPNGATHAKNLRFVEKDENGAARLANEYVWDDTEKQWNLYEGLDTTTLALSSATKRVTFESVLDESQTTRTETKEVRDAAGRNRYEGLGFTGGTPTDRGRSGATGPVQPPEGKYPGSPFTALFQRHRR